MRITISIDDPTPEVTEWLKSLPGIPARRDFDRPPARPPDPGPDPDRPTDGRTLLGWADRHGLRSDVLRLGRSRRYPGKVVDWSHDQVADVYQVLNSKPPKGSQTWGGATPRASPGRSRGGPGPVSPGDGRGTSP